MADKQLTRIAALLRKAEGTDNSHEADAYLQAAQRLATLASVDLAVARAHTRGAERRATPVQRTVQIGEAGKRGLRTYVQLFLAIAHANDLTCDVARNSTLVFAYGFEPDIDAVEALYASLVVQMVRASDAFISAGGHTADLVHRRTGSTSAPGGRRRISWESRPVHPTSARITFHQAFAVRVAERLHAARAAARAEAVAADPVPVGQSGSVEIVLRDRELELADHYRSNSRARGTWSGHRPVGAFSASSAAAGDRAGRRARLGGEAAIGGSAPALPG